MRKAYYLSIVLIFFLRLAVAQQGKVKLISVDFQQAKIDQVVRDLESKTGYHFYYDPVQFDSLRVTLQLTDKPLASILDMAFANTAFHYAITAQQQIFLTKGREIRTELAVGYRLNNRNTSTAPAPAVDYSYDTDTKVPDATTENKLYEIGIKTNTLKAGNATLSGYVRDIKSGEAVVGASIYLPATKTGVATDQFGYYTLSLPRGRHVLTVRGLGMRDTRRQIILYSDGKLIIEMQEQVNSLKEVKISADKVANVKSVDLGVAKLDIKSIKEIPTAFGETDVLKAVLTLPGVTSVGEATTGFNVRGGSADQNLILLNGSTIYNPSHFFGFFAAFNPDIVKNIELYKSSIPEKYGGRLASVLEVTDRDGNNKKYTGSAGIGLLTSRFNIEGPIVNDKTSFIFGARTSYSDWLLSLLPQAYKNSSASFYDMNLDIQHQIDDKNNIYFSSYISHDAFRLNSDTAYAYGNKNINVKWKHNYNTKLFSLVTVGYDRYNYSVSSTQNPVNGYDLTYNINQSNFRADFTYYLNSKNTIDFGLTSTYYLNNPGDYEPDGRGSLVIPQIIEAEHALESALYLGDKYDVNSQLSISAGLRYNVYNYLGAQTVDSYAPNLPRTASNVTDSTAYKSGQIINTYAAPDIRLSARYLLNEDLSVKAGYSTLHQYIHLLENSTAISPTDVYKMSDPNIKPEFGDQVTMGLFQNLSNNTIEMSGEVYYKRLRNILDYRSGAVLVLNQHIEQDVINDDGKAYGAEFLLRKTAGKLTGWVSYTYSRTLLKENDPNAGEQINGGAWYPADYDKPNNFNFTGDYAFSHRYSFSVDVAYSTGRPITLPIAQYEYAGSERVFYSDRNEYRIPDYFRTDIAINIEGNHRVHQFFHNSWSVGVYNLTGRANAYSTFFTEQGGVVSGYQLSIFAKPIPFINYNVRF
jgi:hypothetical protein